MLNIFSRFLSPKKATTAQEVEQPKIAPSEQGKVLSVFNLNEEQGKIRNALINLGATDDVIIAATPVVKKLMEKINDILILSEVSFKEAVFHMSHAINSEMSTEQYEHILGAMERFIHAKYKAGKILDAALSANLTISLRFIHKLYRSDTKFLEKFFDEDINSTNSAPVAEILSPFTREYVMMIIKRMEPLARQEK